MAVFASGNSMWKMGDKKFCGGFFNAVTSERIAPTK